MGFLLDGKREGSKRLQILLHLEEYKHWVVKQTMDSESFKSPTSSEEDLKRFSASTSTLLRIKKLPIDAAEWESYFDESGQILKSQNYVASQILEKGLDLSVRSEAWKFLTGYYPWKSSYDERLTTDSVRRKSYESLCNMYTKIEPLLETEHRDFTEVQNFIPV
ncbi:TBC1 domain family member 21-like [Notechis scutatus]|uniref:TBC1 domain family member 21-like n=1 Tax=Notechis scutatus TaxID=8663 RepID=A0A6J1VIQ4_9SAUR|nr:TBC1 domain family member 21-like [Notechis scutatus]